MPVGETPGGVALSQVLREGQASAGSDLKRVDNRAQGGELRVDGL